MAVTALNFRYCAKDPRRLARVVPNRRPRLYHSGETEDPGFVIETLAARMGGAPLGAIGVSLGGNALLKWLGESPAHRALAAAAAISVPAGSTLVIRSQFDPAETLAAIDREQITAVHLVPTQFVRLLRVADRSTFAGTSLRTVWHGGGACPIPVKRDMIAWWGPVLTEYYGATEGGAVTLIDAEQWLERPGSVGRALPGCELVVVDAEGRAPPSPPLLRVLLFPHRRRDP